MVRCTLVLVVLNPGKKFLNTIGKFADVSSETFDLVVIDGGSTDGTVEVLRSRSDSLTYWASERDQGIASAFNKGLLASQGDLVAFLNAGDWYEPQTLSIVEHAARSNPDADVFCGSIRFWERGKPTIVCRSDPDRLEKETSVYHPTVFIRKSAYDKYGSYDESYRIAMDYELLLRFKRKGAKFFVIDSVLANMPLDGLSYKNWYAGLLEVRRARSAYFSRLDVAYHHWRAVAMNSGARFLKHSGMSSLYQSYWQMRNNRRVTGREA